MIASTSLPRCSCGAQLAAVPRRALHASATRSVGRKYRARWERVQAGESAGFICSFPPRVPDLPVAKPREYTLRVRGRAARSWSSSRQIRMADGSVVTTRTTAPRGTLPLVRDITNHPLWDFPGTELGDSLDQSGRLAAFARRFGGGATTAPAPTSGSSKEQAIAQRAETADLLDQVLAENAVDAKPVKRDEPPHKAAPVKAAAGKKKK